MYSKQKLDYQTYYQNRIGTAEIDINSAIVGRQTDLLMTYKVGELGIGNNGSLKVLFRISTDIPDVQFEEKDKFNYVKLWSTKQDVHFIGYSRTNGAKGMIFQRPWTNGFTIFVKNGFLSEGDKISIQFKKWRMQTYLEKSFEFKIIVDPFAVGKYIEMLHNPTVQIVPDKVAKLVVISPTTVEANKRFNFLIKIEDQWGNPCIKQSGFFEIINYKIFGLKNSQVSFRQGKALVVGVLTKENTTFYIEAKYKKYFAISNPITTVNKNSLKTYWADLHWQSEETQGTNPLIDNTEFAKEYALLDVVSCQGNDFLVDNQLWKKTKAMAKKYSKEQNFLFFLGYEWSGQGGKGGDRNVIYLENNAAIHRVSHALVNGFSDIQTDCLTVEELLEKLKDQKVLMIAHVGGRCSELDKHDENIERLIEIHSDWGTFEWFYFEALERGYQVGVVANSDNHNGRPGSSYPGLEEFDCQGGLTGILAPALDKKTIFNALHKRHCYATTGARIGLDVKCVYQTKVKHDEALIGEKLPGGSSPIELKINCYGASPIEKLEIFNKSKVIHSFYQSMPKNSKFLKITWAGSAQKGKNRRQEWNSRIFFWDIKLKFKGIKIKSLEKLNIFHQTEINNAKDSLIINSHTTGNTQGVILELSKNSGHCDLDVNGFKHEIDLCEQPIIIQTNDLQGKIELTKTFENNNLRMLSYKYKLKDVVFDKHNAFWIKITQRDGHMLWTSPLYFSLPKVEKVLR